MKINHLCYLLLLLVLIGSLMFPHSLLMWFLSVNLLTFLIYGVDKLAACKGWLRVPEITLLLFGVLGGWMGGVLAQQLFRHKTQKQPFATQFIFSVVLNMLAILAAGYWFYGRMVV
ncbi:DUF1294 domain-containing protein [Serratia sp. UGAL515B_01]|uniref:DUF1294 domain-containing protein n=1 Tax=Serratia sp. UGAL515B_01 TaxID=2986763 RepID=UPI002954AF8C|nr:DUF1294 domain-containing protein [Serratia sp. UGAL515B_01]WON78170.1 DUF1294 domain-containing protein [Serratia sp. UGAL515B_01]